MVELTAHNGSDAGSTPAGPTNLVLISFRTTPEEAARIDRAVAFDGKRSRAEWMRGYIMSMVEIVEDDIRHAAVKTCSVDLGAAPVLSAALKDRPIDLSIGSCVHGAPLSGRCADCAVENGIGMGDVEERVQR